VSFRKWDTKGLGETDSRKNLNSKISCETPLQESHFYIGQARVDKYCTCMIIGQEILTQINGDELYNPLPPS
jgi:hypothetical protein